MICQVLVMGATYGSLLGTKLLLAGHRVHLICLPDEADLINIEGTIVRMTPKGRSKPIDVASRHLRGKLSASGPAAINPANFDLVVLAMQEPQYRAPSVRELLRRIWAARIPCLAIMNMPPLPYLARIPGMPLNACRSCYADPSVWDSCDPALMTMCSPDPQAFRPPHEKANVLHVGLPTNFNAAPFDSKSHTALLRLLEKDIEAALSDAGAAISQHLEELGLTWHHLPRTNRVSFHKIAAGIYDDRIYHHGAGSRSPFFEGWGANNTASRHDRLTQWILLDWLFERPDSFLSQLLGKEPPFDFSAAFREAERTVENLPRSQ